MQGEKVINMKIILVDPVEELDEARENSKEPLREIYKLIFSKLNNSNTSDTKSGVQ
ncbi:hypothetical protein J23TS9_01750 [Paenibacillus sp. J23TS9]|uniref:hypothetical protein n=1 Tax=Paenibacillus sp. J23TS9 TaxID=2807193 RepID=UPI001B01797F|nr:hypothetical protein [Paenibacillus sp. J23TS9]GIP25045.1 hypothetical protein J23TS9_01750 [Paenibacillus sp. J23TS9]